ncbi:MAG TPA: SufD family Fe-S cluster assembly protein [Candidatus Limnocylindrales bacterium]|nr:SufD family Fe-S cluster assembly protein [Candidatus Limnocylindrales bacterium]
MSLARPPRAPRQAPADLTFSPDEALLARWAADEPDWLTADRAAALERFSALPTESNVLYTPYIDLRAADLAEVRAWEEPAGAPDGPGLAVPDGAAGLAELVEDRVEGLVLDPAVAALGVTLDTFGGLIGRDPDAATRLIGDPASLPLDDRLAQLTRAAWNQGIALRVPAGVRVEHPIVLRWGAGAPGRALLTRTIIELGDGASAVVLEELVPSGPEIACAEGETVPQALFTGTLEVRLGAGAELSVASIQEFGPRVIAFQHRDASIGDGARLHWALAQLGSRLVRSRVDNRLDGDRSNVEQVEIVFGSDEQVFDLTSFTRHVGRDTTGNLLSKGALLDRSRGYMKGLIQIEKSAVGTDSFLGEFGMNLSKQARAVAIPSLEIDQPDCRRAAHSSSVGPIDETQLFYLESRGIPPDEARKFIVLGFLEPVVARVPLVEAQDRLRALLEAKWAAGSAAAPDAPDRAGRAA